MERRSFLCLLALGMRSFQAHAWKCPDMIKIGVSARSAPPLFCPSPLTCTFRHALSPCCVHARADAAIPYLSELHQSTHGRSVPGWQRHRSPDLPTESPSPSPRPSRRSARLYRLKDSR